MGAIGTCHICVSWMGISTNMGGNTGIIAIFAFGATFHETLSTLLLDLWKYSMLRTKN